MKNGLWIGGLVLALLGQGSDLWAGDDKWRAVGDAPQTQSPVAELQAPVALKPTPLTATPVLSPIPGGILPVRFDAPAPPSAPAPKRINAEIIAVSAPLIAATASPTLHEEETTESLFAVDRPLRTGAAIRRTSGTIVRTSASVPASSNAGVSTIPGWDAPVDASWGVGPPLDAAAAPFANPPPGGANGRKPHFYFLGEYLLWWLQGDSVPVLATTSAPADFGVLGAPTTQVLFGGNTINGNSPFSGGRFTVGAWLDCENTKAFEFTGFFLGQRAANFNTNTAYNPVIGRPFLEANNGTETAQLTSLPSVTTGALSVYAPTSLWGLEGNLRCLLCCGCNYRISALAGFRNINLEERLSITESIQGLATAPQPFTNQMITVNDSFATRNHFYGGQIGADARYYWGRWSVDVRGKLALGDTVQLLDINGSQRFVSPTGVVQNFTGGLLALPSNIGHFTNNAFSVVPEVGLNLGYQILPGLRGFVGYNFLYWSNVIRPGSSIDRNLDVTQIPNFPLNPEPAPLPGQHPAPVFHEVGLWAQGVTFGFEFVY